MDYFCYVSRKIPAKRSHLPISEVLDKTATIVPTFRGLSAAPVVAFAFRVKSAVVARSCTCSMRYDGMNTSPCPAVPSTY